MGISEQVVKPATRVVGFFCKERARKGDFAMDQSNISLIIALIVFLGAPFLFLHVWHRKHASPLPWKAYPLCCLIACGIAFSAGFLLSHLVGSTFYTLAYAFQLDPKTSALAARIALSLMAAVLAALAGLYVLKKVKPLSTNS